MECVVEIYWKTDEKSCKVNQLIQDIMSEDEANKVLSLLNPVWHLIEFQRW